MTTTKRRRPNNSFGTVKKFLVAGTFAATMIGTQLIGQQDTAANFNEPVMVVVPANQGQQDYALPPNYRGNEVQLEAIPQAVTPDIAPVARTQSSQ